MIRCSPIRVTLLSSSNWRLSAVNHAPLDVTFSYESFLAQSGMTEKFSIFQIFD